MLFWHNHRSHFTVQFALYFSHEYIFLYISASCLFLYTLLLQAVPSENQFFSSALLNLYHQPSFHSKHHISVICKYILYMYI